MTTIPTPAEAPGAWPRDIKRQLRLPTAALAPAGPVRQLLHHRARWALAVWLAAAFVAVPSSAEVDLPYKALADRAGIPRTHRASSRTAAVTRAVDLLVAVGLCERMHERYRDAQFKLLALDGTRRPYAMPDFPQALALPGALCGNGWLGALPQAALAVLLIARRESDRQWVRHHPPADEGRFDAGRNWIHDHYGITPTTWAKGKTILGRYGILTWQNGIQQEERVRFRSAYTLRLDRLSRPPGAGPLFRMTKVPRVTRDPESGRAYRQFTVQWVLEDASAPEPVASGEGVPMA